MKKLIVLLMMLSVYGSAVHAQFLSNRSNGICLTQDEKNLYFTSPESQSFITLDKASLKLTFTDLPVLDNNTMRLADCAVVKDGDVWFTYGPYIVRYSDGKIVNYRVEESPHTSIGHFTGLALAPDGNIWATTHAGPIGIVGYDCSFTPVDISRSNSETLTLATKRDLVVDQEGNIWVVGSYKSSKTGHAVQSLNRIAEGKMEAVPVPEDFGIGYGECFNIEIDNAGSIWYSTRRHDGEKIVACMLKYDGVGYTLYELPTEMIVMDFKFDAQGRCWVLPWIGPIICVEDFESGQYTLYDHKELALNGNDLRTMLHLEVDGETVYAIGSKYIMPGNIGTYRQRPLLFTIKDGQVSYAEIGPDSDSKSLNAISSVSASTENTNALFDLQGRRLTAEPAQGVYIQNGRKIIR